MKHIYVIMVVLMTTMGYSQNTEEKDIPYREVPEYSEEFTAGTVAGRMVDALGFRFYWASEGLTDKDLAYKPNDDVRSAGETIEHILDLSYVIVNSTLKKPNSNVDTKGMTYADKRKQALKNLKTAADILKLSDDISQYKIIYGNNVIPFWNQINGPIADSIWHCGQLASYRRSSGNPINPKVNHFSGTVRE